MELHDLVEQVHMESRQETEDFLSSVDIDNSDLFLF